MRKLIRSQLTWMVAAEVAVVGALIVVGWSVLATSARAPMPPSPSAVQATDPTADPATDLPALPQIDTAIKRGPLPGLAVDPTFWRDRLSQLNGEQVYLEQLEWQIVHSAESAAGRYLQTVVLPAIQQAEQAGGAVPVV